MQDIPKPSRCNESALPMRLSVSKPISKHIDHTSRVNGEEVYLPPSQRRVTTFCLQPPDLHLITKSFLPALSRIPMAKKTLPELPILQMT
jgi:hypothetical protein